MLFVHRSERADFLVEALGDLLLDALDDPMATEIVAVPSRGVERWLTQRLSHRLGAAAGGADGVCANVGFPFPGALIGAATSTVCGFDPETDPWVPDRSVWPLLQLVDAHLAEPFLAPLAAHLRAGSPDGSTGAPTRRFATVRHVADLYDRYAVHRPDMILAWAGSGGAGGSAPTRRAAAPDAEWQAELWRRLRARVGVPSPAERLEVVTSRLAEEPGLLDLPPRLSLFGLTRLPASHLRVLRSVARHRDVHLFLLHPSGRLWEAVDAAVTSVPRPLRRSDDSTGALAVNPLLRSWGRDAREMQLVLRAHGVTGGDHRPVPDAETVTPRTVLQLIQADVRGNRLPPGAPSPHSLRDERAPLDPDDDSLLVHSCHGRLRQVEVLRDAILHLLADDPTLEPRDIVVMCPDIESFAPLVHAVFAPDSRQPETGDDDGRPGREPGPPEIRVRLADRSIRQTNPVLGVAARLLQLASGRVTASEVLDLAGSEPVSRRFHFDEDDLGQLERWVAETGIRWGLDGGHRVPWKLGDVKENTWQAGLDRLLLGVAMAEEDERVFHGVLPLDDVSSGSVDLAGRVAELVDRLQSAVAGLQGRRTVGGWTAALVEATESLAAAAPHEQWQHDQLHRVLRDAADAAGAEEWGSALLDLAEVRSLLDDRLRGRPTRANFRTGDLTICTLVPMRSVPHRVIGLLGLDDGAFPRHSDYDGDDLLLADPHVGDRDARSEDRQLLLDALLAAGEHLVVTYEGRDPRTNEQRSPSVPIAELLDVVDRTVRVPDDPGARASDRIVVEHPLQSFDRRNFSSDGLVAGPSWSFDPVDLEGARSLAAPRVPRRPFLAGPLDRLDTPVVQLDSLVRFLEHPVRAFLRERLGWYGAGGSEEVKDSLPVELDALERWGVGDRLLAARLAGASADRALAAEHGRGLLPPGALAGAELHEIEATVEGLAAAAASVIEAGSAAPGSVEVNLRLADGRTLLGTVPDVYDAAGVAGREARIVRCSYSQLAPRQRIAAWARFLALTAAHPDRRVTAVTIGRGPGGAPGRPRIAIVRLPALDGDPQERRAAALARLGDLVDLFDRGMCEPLPLSTRASEAFVDAALRDAGAIAAARKLWESTPDGYGENRDPEHLLVLGGEVRFDEILRFAPREHESGPGWTEQTSRFGRLAFRLWQPLVDHEQREHRS